MRAAVLTLVIAAVRWNRGWATLVVALALGGLLAAPEAGAQGDLELQR